MDHGGVVFVQVCAEVGGEGDLGLLLGDGVLVGLWGVGFRGGLGIRVFAAKAGQNGADDRAAVVILGLDQQNEDWSAEMGGDACGIF